MATSNATPDWRLLLQDQVRRAGRAGKAQIAIELGVSRAYVSRVMNPDGKSGIAVVAPQFIARVLRRYHVIACPARGGTSVVHVDCAKANAAAPTHNPFAVMIWRTCQTCPHKPRGDQS